MKIIKKLSEMIEDELDSACRYAKCALNYKEENPQLAEIFYTISVEKMKHMALLHTQVVNIITEYRKTKGDPPVSMQAVYDYLHEKHMEHAAEIKAKQNLYKEQ